MKFANVHDLLLAAGSDAQIAYEYNLDKPQHMRISRVGQPLVSLLLEDFLFSKLPELPKKPLTEVQENGKKIKALMAQGTGYYFEQVVIEILKKNPNLKIFPQYKVDLGYLSGTCDIVVVNEAEARVTVVECKALKYGTKKEACSEALFNDMSTGYLSQLTVYKHALQQEYGLYEVDACWMVWCKATASHFKVKLQESKVNEQELIDLVKMKCMAYKLFASFYNAKDLDQCLNMLNLSSLPLKTPFFSGWSAACSAHYSPWIHLLLDETGVPWEDAEDHLKLMLKVSLENDGQAADSLLQLMKEH